MEKPLPKHLEQRRRRWYATLDIPKDVRPAYKGKARFVQSLKTESITVAERRAPVLVARWKAEIHAVRTGEPAHTDELRETAQSWREMLDAAPDQDAVDTYEMILQDKAEEIDARNPGAGLEAFKLATRQWIETGEKIEEWLSTLDNEPKSIDMKRSDLHRFAKRFNVSHKVEKRKVQKWVLDLQTKDGLKLSTIRRIISACRGYWDYLQRKELVSDDRDPFRDAVPKQKKNSKATFQEKRRTFSPEAVVSLLQAAQDKGDHELGRLIWAGMWTGCRIEELCALRVEDVQEDRFVLTDAKSEAGLREVPIHSQLRPALQRMCATSKDGYVFSGLTFNKYQDRSNAVGKRFGRLKTALGFDKTYVYHSLRKTVATQLDAAGVSEAVSARIVGHDLKTMTYGLYSGGIPFEKKRDALEALSYPLEGDSHTALWEQLGNP
ncbi:hypothetical protein B6V72_14595 [Thioclava sp. F34-6]|nr:hypothetical protein B6V72_14595 [Thioclava sp. F34-6]